MKITSFRINGRNVSRLTINGRNVILGLEPVLCDALCFTALEPGSTVQLHKNGSAPDVSLLTSTNGSSWTPYAVNDVITLANVDDKVYFKAVGSNTKINSNLFAYNNFVMTGKIAASGNINSLLEEDEETARTMSLYGKKSCYSYMFYGCSSLTQAPELPATTLDSYCYSYMFYGCSSLTQAPELPADDLVDSCYAYMFYNCTSLTQAPELPATTLANNCYSSMFKGCSSLTQAPELLATILNKYCYSYMFYECSSLTQAPALPATTLDSYCYENMFRGCTALAQAPELPATTLANNCYSSMFYECSSLTQAPALPATTLADNCYYNMFYNCTSLAQAPELPATILNKYCYSYMFKGCTSLNSIKSAFTTWLDGSTKGWLDNVAASGTFECPQTLIDNTTTRDANTVPESWTMVAV